MNVLVTGAAGFLGRHVVVALKDHGHEVLPTDRVANAGVTLLDLDQPSAIQSILAESSVDAIVHLAGLVEGSSEELYQANFINTLNLLRSLQNRRLLLVGTAAEYGPVSEDEQPVSESRLCFPIGAYGCSKHAGVLSGLNAARSGSDVVVVRPFNIVGPGIGKGLVLGGLLSRIVEKLGDESPTIKMGNLDPTRDFLGVEDVADGITLAIERGTSGSIFNICSGQPTAIRDIVGMVQKSCPRHFTVEQDPALVRASDLKSFTGDPSRARNDLGFEPMRDLQDCVARATNHALRHIDFGSV